MESNKMLSVLINKVQTSTASVASSVSSSDDSPLANSVPAGFRQLKAGVRRLSVPLAKAGQGGRKKLGQLAHALSDMIDVEIEDGGSSEGDKGSSLFGSSLLNREWDIDSVNEMCRRLDLDTLEMPIPLGAEQSVILDENMIRQIMNILPPRAVGYPWLNIYNSEKHGFSLATFYRKMAEFDEDLSPVLLIIRDTKDHVFGAVVSSAIRPSEHFFGTGDSCLLWKFVSVEGDGDEAPTKELRHFSWTGANHFFVNAAKDALVIGSGTGDNGLWLDADLNKGRSQKCETFDNEPLVDEDEDFVVQFVEAFGFRMQK